MATKYKNYNHRCVSSYSVRESWFCLFVCELILVKRRRDTPIHHNTGSSIISVCKTQKRILC